MGWEMRKSGTYYYRKKRRNGRVVSEYMGSGEAVEAIARLEELDRADVREQRARERAEREAAEALDAQLATLERDLRTLTMGTLLLAGCHTHHGQWRGTTNCHEQETPSGTSAGDS